MTPMMRRVIVLASVLAVAGCAGARSNAHASPLVGKHVEIEADDLQGAGARVDTGRGVVQVIDFWASWCDPCRDQIPALDRLARAYRDRGVVVYAVSFDEDRSQVQAFLEARPVSFPVLWDKGGARLAESLQIYRLPTTLVLDRAGVVRYAHVGYEPSEADRLEREVRSLAGEGG
jgi:thiol-disulfide isomerase/thioredoxin